MVMTGRRVVSTAGVAVLFAVVVGSGGVAAEPSPGAELSVSATEGRPGETIEVGATGCFSQDEDFYRFANVRLVSSGPEPVVLAFGRMYGDQRIVLTLPDWHAPGEGHVVANCIEVHPGSASTEVFEYAPVGFDLLAGDGPGSQTLTVGRAAVREGQVIPFDATGCDPGSDESQAFAYLVPGHDLSGATWDLGEAAAGVAGRPDGRGTVHVDLVALNANGELSPGPYLMLVTCPRAGRRTLFRAAPVTVTGSNPVGTVVALYDVPHDLVAVQGEGCTGGAAVTVEVVQNPWEGNGATVERHDVPPDPDGGWLTLLHPPTDERVELLEVTADCGDPSADGFRYLTRQIDLTTAGSDQDGRDDRDDRPGPSPALPAAPLSARAEFTG